MTETLRDVLSAGSSVGTRAAGRHYGKYRGTVSDNQDPNNQGRIKANVPEILGEVESGWALPCAPYAGDKTGVYTVPPVGSGVWVEFEAGDVSRPIWVGCWWQGDKLPTDEGGTAATPDVKIARSEQGLLLALHDDSQKIALSDSDGSNILEIEAQQGNVKVKAGTKVTVDGPQIELVANASHSAVFGDNLLTFLNQLVTMFNTHMHPGQMAGPFPVTPMTPVPPLTPPTPSLLSTTVKLG
jgi:uncharacterized protein involved in type VI secretion and phage assembly